jgi:secreted trypsin-like serine protease
MKILRAVSAGIAIAAGLGVLAVSAGAAEKFNWAREYVKLHEYAVLQRAVGPERAAAVRARMEARIVGGTTAKPAANPFQVGLLQKAEPDNFFAQFCGGTLYKPNVVVTAAHCSVIPTLPVTAVQVLTGTRKLDGTGVRRDVLKIIVHPDYNPGTFDSDVAVWILKTKATGIETAKLASPTTELTKGKTLATGWGETESIPHFPIDLQQVIVPLQPKSDCNDADSYDGFITNNMICAGLDAGGKDTCQGDSGGPLTARLNDEGGLAKYDVLTGITSFGTGCADPELFGVYTRVAKFRTWINAQLP